MTRAEAIEIINRENDPNDKKVWELFPEYREALDMAIKALEQQPTEIEEIDFVQEHKKIPVTLDLTLLSDNATNGDVIMAMFPNADIEIHNITVYVVFDMYSNVIPFDLDWWNNPYQKGGKE